MVKFRAWAILLARALGQRILSATDDPHLTTDPACIRHRAPKAGSLLDRHSRGVSCSPCMVARAFGWQS